MRLNKILKIVLMAFFVFPFSLASQDQWVHIYCPLDLKPGFILDKVIPFSGGGYVGTGHCCKDESCDEVLLYLGRTDSHGNFLWAKQFAQATDCWGPPLNVLDNGDGTITVTKANFSSILKFDKDGNIIFEKGYQDGLLCDIIHSGTIIANNGDLYSLIADSFNEMTLLRINYSDGKAVFAKYFHWGGFYFEGKVIAVTTDNNIVMFGIGSDWSGAVIVKVDESGDVIWARRCDAIYEKSDTRAEYRMSATGDGGFLLLVAPEGGSLPTIVIKMDKDGNVAWQEKIIVSYNSRTEPAYLLGAAEYEDGSIMIAGMTKSEDPVTIKLSEKGEAVAGTLIYVPYYSLVYPSDIVAKSEGYVFISHGPFGFSCYDWMGVCGAIGTLDQNGKPPAECYQSIDIDAVAESTSLAFWAISQPTSGDSDPIVAYPISMSLIDVPNNVVGCGDSWPAILSAQKATNPFRLKLTGWNFQQSSEVYVNGSKAGKVTFKGTDSYNKTKIVVKGSDFKALLPKGQPVCITVKNPDGHESDCFTFTR